MSSSTVRVSQEVQAVLRELASREHTSMQAILEKAIEEYRVKVFFDDVNQRYAALRANPEVWNEELDERRSWDTALGDGLKRD